MRETGLAGPYSVLIMGLLGTSTVLVAWQLVVVLFRIPEYLVPSPIVVLEAVGADWKLLLEHSVPTLIEAFAGFVIGNLVAIVLAILFVWNKRIEEMYYPMAIIVKTIPILAIAPILKILMGNGMEPKIAIAALITFFPTLVNTVRGLRSVDPALIELFHVMMATKRELFFRVRIYSALPYIFAALKIGVTSSVLGAIIGEWIGTNSGLGYLILQSMYDFMIPRLYATIVVACAISVVGILLVAVLERYLVRWDTGIATT